MFFCKNVTLPPVRLAVMRYRRMNRRYALPDSISPDEMAVGGRPVGLGEPGTYRQLKRRYEPTAGSSCGNNLPPDEPAAG